MGNYELDLTRPSCELIVNISFEQPHCDEENARVFDQRLVVQEYVPGYFTSSLEVSKRVDFA